ncbi:c-type cytochrome [Marinoscillum sp. MHG1-6]|uniref:c-type cytochrome n=1 Tax=Marinoscillum sp. MHG1-6 TaxID=2959627 RepID=UPI002157F3AB|nr:c-type cytochrome [Marinoscillum sp. MHG1-6]
MKEGLYVLGCIVLGLFLGFLSFALLHYTVPDWFHLKEEGQQTQLIVQKPWKLKNVPADLPGGEKGLLIKYGYDLIVETSNHIGPLAQDENMRFAGNNLTCNNCHLKAGRKIGSGSFIGVYNRFPQFRGRENKMGTLEDRINGCMERSMSGKVLPVSSKEMAAMVAYMKWLSEDVPEDVEKLYKGYVSIQIPNYKADPDIGKKLYREKCQHCHMENGLGTKKVEETFTGYLYPPIGGPDSFNDGAGMNRVITAAEFLKGNMPLGATYDVPVLTDEEAYHLGAYINTFDRPVKENKQADFPDIKLKPISTPYGPWADDFSPEQHKFGPFPPIMDFYKKEYGLVKNK